MPLTDSQFVFPGSTDSRLIQGAKDLDANSWKTLVEDYGPMIYQIARRSGLQPTDASDVAQTVLVELTKSLHKFDRKNRGSFRRWLKVITRNKVIDFWRRQDTPPQALHVNDIPAVQTPVYSDEVTLNDRQMQLLDILSQVRRVVSEQTWQAFEMMQSGLETSESIGKRLGISADAVRMAKRRVLLQIELLLKQDDKESL
ncbi:RNA polymerase sigma factor [Polystyrenella longa]|uniref:RNA polymerase sigma factor n=1 Tax=Polystyrenella longa TaxID=2528007 RepID=A0A518CGV0_9PLAN|nr:sigma-70 family RNA polymerase sigma factor [Polystyrenella longa]QDU78450.1 RNA polymerase sigma factor [Polystyrenella longa]